MTSNDIFQLRKPIKEQVLDPTLDSFLESVEGVYMKMKTVDKIDADVERIDSKIGLIEMGIADVKSDVKSTGSYIEDINQRIDKLEAIIGDCESNYLQLFTGLDIENEQCDEEMKQMWDELNIIRDEQVGTINVLLILAGRS